MCTVQNSEQASSDYPPTICNPNGAACTRQHQSASCGCVDHVSRNIPRTVSISQPWTLSAVLRPFSHWSNSPSSSSVPALDTPMVSIMRKMIEPASSKRQRGCTTPATCQGIVREAPKLKIKITQTTDPGFVRMPKATARFAGLVTYR